MLNNADSILAKLLATENISTVTDPSLSTAAFDLKNRVLYTPDWSNMSPDVKRLLTFHEVGHALNTPEEGWHKSISVDNLPKSYLNIIEDIRIEKAIQKRFPGSISSFVNGYKELFDKKVFGDIPEDEVSGLGLPDRINIKSKIGALVEVSFSPDEEPVVNQCFTATTWEEVVAAAKALAEFVKQNKEEVPSNEKEIKSNSTDSGDSDSDLSDELSDDQDTPEAQSEGLYQEFEEVGEESEDTQTVKSDEGGDYSELEEAITDVSFRNSETQFANSVDDCILIKVPTSEDCESIVLDHNYYLNSLEKQISTYIERGEQFFVDKYADVNVQAKARLDEIKPVVAHMAKEFENKKRAKTMLRKKISKTGAIDLGKVHSYKYNEDIFLRKMTFEKGKNHGLYMLVDFSGSMTVSIHMIIKQIIQLAMFCRKVNIPYKVTSFTDSYAAQAAREVNSNSNLELDSLYMIDLFDTKMSNRDFDKMCVSLMSEAIITEKRMYGLEFGNVLTKNMGGTPLVQSLLVSNKRCEVMKKKHNIEVMNLMVIADGDAGQIRYQTKDYIQRLGTFNNVSIDLGNHVIKYTPDMCQRGTIGNYLASEIVAYMNKRFNMIGFFAFHTDREMKYYVQRMYQMENVSDLMKEIRAEIRKDGAFLSPNKIGNYENFYLLRVDNKFDTVEGEFTSTSTTKGNILRDFKSHSKSKKRTRVFVNKLMTSLA